MAESPYVVYRNHSISEQMYEILHALQTNRPEKYFPGNTSHFFLISLSPYQKEQ
ncbi:hypothetical protein JCM10003_47 [Bacteroides pyogenes JCM 10003]|nr:hypothetical protein JCM10003_47 [Bacteroides pyogenes JCM 10003]